MVLGDAALAEMTGDKWDRALRVKIESGWIFHEETLNDPIEIFIMFSSIASVIGNRNQGNYNVGNTFLNALAEYRQRLGLPAISVALGAMSEFPCYVLLESRRETQLTMFSADIGVLHSLGREDMLGNLTRGGLSHLQKPHLAKIMEAAVLESPCRDRSLIVTGLEMFERVDGKIASRPDQLYWTEVPEFGHLQVHKRSDLAGQGKNKVSLRQRIMKLNDDGAARMELRDEFITFISQLLRFGKSTFMDTSELSMYGLDSLSAVSCQYWFFRGEYTGIVHHTLRKDLIQLICSAELGVDVKVSELLENGVIENVLKNVITKLRASRKDD